MVGKKEHVNPRWKVLRNDIDLEEPTPLLNQVSLDCIQRDAGVDHHALQAQSTPVPTHRHHRGDG